MRNIINISLPQEMSDYVKNECKSKKYSVSEFFRKLIRDYEEEKILKEIKKSEEDYKAGRYYKNISIKDIK